VLLGQGARKIRVVIVGHGDPYVKNAYLSKLAKVLSDLDVPHDFWVWSRDPEYTPSAEVHVVLRFAGWGSGAKVAWGYLVWMAILTFKMSTAGRNRVFFCSRFDTALPCAVASVLRGARFVFLDRDTFSKSYRWPKPVKWLLEKAERFVASQALLHVVPGSSRISKVAPNLRVVRNTPHREFIRVAKSMANDFRAQSNDLRVLISGLISPARGARWMLETVRALEGHPARFTLAGRLDGADATELARSPNVTYVGLLGNTEALALTLESDVVWAFYDPALEINRLAEPNKWFDCAALRVPFVTNRGLSTSTPFEDANACFLCDYGSTPELKSLTIELCESRLPLKEKQAGLAKLAYAPWDEAISGVVKEALTLAARQ
jgi:hypothetical protein